MARHRSLAAPHASHKTSTRPHHLPGIEASSLPSLRRTEVGIPTSLSHRSRNSDFAFLPEKKTHHRASAGGPSARLFSRVPLTECFFTIRTPSRQSWRGRRIAQKNPSPGQRRRCVSDAVLAGATDIVFFYHSHAQPSILAWAQDCPTQSWRGHRIAPLNPGVGTGLLHSILAWAQDCSTQSWCGHRIAPLNPGVGTGLPRCLPENSVRASLHRDALLDSPPGLPGKLRQRPAV